jgi:outer membrane protein
MKSSFTSTICVVDNKKLFEDFTMTKEIKKQGELYLKKRKITLDSLNVQFALAETEELKQHLYQVIIKEQEEMQSFNETYNNEETTKIWKRIEGYVKEYGKVKEFDIIIGSQLQGDVLYVDDKKDITVDLLNYINKKYEGFN